MAEVDIRDRSDRSNATVAELIGDLSRELSTLIHQEIELAKAEMAEKGKRAGIGAGMFGVAGLTAVLGLACLTGCIVAALQLAMPVWLAALIVGVAYEAVAGCLVLMGTHEVRRAVPPVPKWQSRARRRTWNGSRCKRNPRRNRANSRRTGRDGGGAG